MSQHVFRVDEKTECMVGWDPPLGSFFGQVYEIDAEGERLEETDPICWVGASGPPIFTVDDLLAKLAPVVIPEEIRKELYATEVD
ncbi:MAG: hypothetical protein AAB691_03575 [Patescibacteria group bacterium]